MACINKMHYILPVFELDENITEVVEIVWPIFNENFVIHIISRLFIQLVGVYTTSYFIAPKEMKSKQYLFCFIN